MTGQVKFKMRMPLYHLRFFIALCYFVAVVVSSDDMHISCNVTCNTTEGVTYFRQEETCCHYIKPITKPDRHHGIPPPIPMLYVNWYIHKTIHGKVIALNLTWLDLSSVVFGNSSKGYRISILRQASSVPSVITFEINKQMKRRDDNVKVSISYVQFGWDPEDLLDPGHQYTILFKGLPELEITQNMEEDEALFYVITPVCRDFPVKDTLNCADVQEDRQGEVDYDFPTEEVPTTKVQKDSSQTIVIALIAVTIISVIVVIFLCSLFVWKRQRTPAHDSGRKIFMVISSRESCDKSWFAQAGDEISCYLKDMGMKVTFTLWNAIEIMATDSFQWVKTNVNEADHVIVLYTTANLKHLSSENKKQISGFIEDQQPLLNPAFDPYVIVRRMINIDEDNNKFTAVHFEKSKKNVQNLFQVKTFQLPEDFSEMLQRVTKCRNVYSQQKQTCEEKLSILTQKIRSNVPPQNDIKNGCTLPKIKPECDSIRYEEEQPDSGYLTNLTSNQNSLEVKLTSTSCI